MAIEDYIRNAAPNFEQNGFFEQEIGRVTEQYGDMVHVFSTYESRKRKRRGILPRHQQHPTGEEGWPVLDCQYYVEFRNEGKPHSGKIPEEVTGIYIRVTNPLTRYWLRIC